MGEVLIPPWVRPESPETLRWIDDATVAFPPAFGRGTTQRGIWADPRWGLRRRYRGLRSDEKAAILNALNDTRGQFNVLRVTPHTPIRGSFATTELLTNNTFASGTTGWSAESAMSIAATDRVCRVTRTVYDGTFNSTIAPYQSISLTGGVPYVVRMMLGFGRGMTSAGAVAGSSSFMLSQSGMAVGAIVPSATGSVTVGAVSQQTTGLAGDYFSVFYSSLARCALADNGPNGLVRSDEFDNASWTKTAASVSANSTTAPDGATTADSIVENSANTAHFVVQSGIVIGSSAVDICFAVALKANTRTWAQLQLFEQTGSTTAAIYVNLSTGALGTITTGANWANVRGFTRALGNGWYYVALIARKTNAATLINPAIVMATADGTNSYLGNGSSSIYAWRATFKESGVPLHLTQTTSGGTTGTTPTGNSMYTKGWPVSTDGLLLTGDWFEINGELKQLTAPVNSDAAGLAHLQFRPGLAGSPADNDPIIVLEPFGRFIYPQGTRELSNLFGVYADCEMDLEEIYV